MTNGQQPEVLRHRTCDTQLFFQYVSPRPGVEAPTVAAEVWAAALAKRGTFHLLAPPPAPLCLALRLACAAVRLYRPIHERYK